MTQRNLKRLDVPIRIQVLIPSALCLAVLFVALFCVAVPFVKKQLFSIKRDMICELTEATWHLLQQYHMRIQSGELTRAEAQSRALEQIRAMRYGPGSRDYFWILDLSGKILMHPIQTDLEETSGLDIIDANGKRFVEAMVRTAIDEEDGLVDYYWPRPDRPDQPVPKMSYVRIFQPWDWIIGTGVYIDDLHAEIDRITGRLQIIFLGCLAVLAILAIWLSLLSRRIERRRRDAEQLLAAGEKQHRASLENMVSGFVLFDLIGDDSGKLVDARVIQVNPAALRITGITVDPIGHRLGELFPDTIAERMTQIEEALGSGLPFRKETFIPEINRWLDTQVFSPQHGRFAVAFTDITERKTAEEQFARELNLRQMLLDQLPCAAMILKNGTREIVSCNEIARKMGAAPGLTCFSTFDGKDAPCSFCLAPKVWETGLPQKIEVEHHKGGWCECIWIPLPDDLYVHYIFDITERKSAEEALKASEERYRLSIDNMINGFVLHEVLYDNAGNPVDARILQSNPAAHQFTGIPNLVGRTLREIFGDPLPPRFARAMEVVQTGQSIHYEDFYPETNRWLEVLAFRQQPGRYVVTFMDITERKQILDTLQRNEQQLRLIVENSTDMISSHAPDSTIRYISPSCRTLLGYEPEELLGCKSSDFAHPDDAPAVTESILSAIRSRNPGFQVEHRVRRKNEAYIWIENYGRLFYDSAGELTEIQCSLRDITERRQNEEALRVVNSRYQAILAAIPDIVAEVDITHRYTWLNPAGLAFFGGDAVGHYAHEYFIGDQATYQSVQPLFNGGDETIYIESWQRRNDGKRRLLGWWCRPLRDALGRVIGALSTARDITEAQLAQRQREQLLASLETKNEELQSVLYTASHDLRSPLVNIQGFGGELERACGKLKDLLASPDGPDTRRQIEALLTDAVPESLHFVRAGADKMQMLLDGLLRLSRVGSLEITLEPLNMDELLGKVLHAQRFQIQQHRAEVTVDPLPACVGDVVMVNQLFSNLIDNALKYSDPSRSCRIHITGRIVDSSAVYAVADNGIGIEPEHQQDIFQIFYRLHPGGKISGEGLGLAIVKRILDRLQGSVRIESNPGQGTTFSVSLPLPDTEK